MAPFWACCFLFNSTIFLFCRCKNWVIEFKRLAQGHTARKWWDQIWPLAAWIQSPCSKLLYYAAEGWGEEKEAVRKGRREGWRERETDRQTHTNTHMSVINSKIWVHLLKWLRTISKRFQCISKELSFRNSPVMEPGTRGQWREDSALIS